MDEAVLMQANIHKRTKSRKIGHQAGQFHTHLEVLDVVDIVRKREFLRSLARVPSRFLQFQDDVVDGGQAELFLYVVLRLDLLAQLRISHQLLGAHMEVAGHFVHNVVCFRMYGGIVQRIGRPRDAEEAGALLKGLGAQARHLLELFPAGEIAVFAAIRHNGLG